MVHLVIWGLLTAVILALAGSLCLAIPGHMVSQNITNNFESSSWELTFFSGTTYMRINLYHAI
jgi:hypothetical protein